ncbi:hypothetical protein CLV78_102435 [Aliiruegeria haliotis]|uniref:Uncharacterized protein n=1 Tax=Aliiruegeria haliotis TaxID=1280846 RepID=A0A2T0RVT2_9RHOB|nr:hypothetical protein CLV78_102435 [Aliiruegeria haliotis]
MAMRRRVGHRRHHFGHSRTASLRAGIGNDRAPARQPLVPVLVAGSKVHWLKLTDPAAAC